MKVRETFARPRPQFSFEFFPPKDAEGVETLLATVRSLRILNPAYVSVTYGAGGSTRSRSLEVARRIKGELDLEVVAHVTCAGSTEAELREVLRHLESDGIENVLALRGDPPKGEAAFTTTAGGYAYATDLIGMLARDFSFGIGAAAYPEGHPEAMSLEADLRYAKAKVDAGAEFLVTQLFFDNAVYFDYVARARAIGIAVPIVPGIMPIGSYAQIARMTKMCGATIPQPLLTELELRSDEPSAVTDLGVAFCTLQCADLLERGAPGIHFYTLNRSPATRAVLSALLAARPFRDLISA